MKLKASELTGDMLDWAVAKAENNGGFAPVRYSTKWEFGGPVIEREEIRLTPPFAGEKDWLAACGNPDVAGPTPLIAAMRCYVASKLGAEFEVPDEVN